MKLLSLNIWGGRVFDPLIEFIKNNAEEVDVFCFQEVFSTGLSHIDIIEEKYRSDIYGDIAKVLPDHQGYSAVAISGFDFDKHVEFPLTFGLATFVKKDLVVERDGNVIVVEGEETDRLNDKIPRNMQFVEIKKDDERFAIFNIHGLWVPEGKDDNPKRIRQSELVLETMRKFDCKKILCGDFNLRPDTESVKILESELINLIRKNGVTDTRGSLCPFPERFADYTFVSDDVKVNSFALPDAKVSDHLPMITDFE